MWFGADPILRNLGATATNSGQDPAGDRPQSYGATGTDRVDRGASVRYWEPHKSCRHRVRDIIMSSAGAAAVFIWSLNNQIERETHLVTPGVIPAILIKVATSACQPCLITVALAAFSCSCQCTSAWPCVKQRLRYAPPRSSFRRSNFRHTAIAR